MRGDRLGFSLPRALARFPNLQKVDFKDIVKSSESNQRSRLAGLGDENLELLVQSCPSLVCLTLVRCGVVSDEGLATVLRGCPELRTLRMDHCEGFSGAAFEGVRCSLEELSLQYCSGVTSTGVGALAAACPGLQVFNLRMEGKVADLDVGLKRVASLCPSLEKLSMIACGVRDATLRSFATKCPRLADVRIVGEPRITDAGVMFLRVHLHHLAHLTLLNNRQLIQVPRSGRFLRLKDLGVGRFVRVSDRMLQQISEEQSLEELRIVSCPALTDATVRKILFGCRHLRHLLIADCELLTLEILKAHAESGSKAKIEVRGCKGVQEKMLPEEMRLSGNVVTE